LRQRPSTGRIWLAHMSQDSVAGDPPTEP